MAMPGSFLDPRNPRGPDCGIDEWSPLRGELQVSAPAGSVFIQDTRSWHSTAPNFSPDPRVGIVVRYTPWWLTCSYGTPSGDGCSAEWVPSTDFARWSPQMQDLYRHRACGVRDTIHPSKQAAAEAVRQTLRENLQCGKNAFFLRPCVLLEASSFTKDRLGTNIGKTHKKSGVFSLQARDGRREQPRRSGGSGAAGAALQQRAGAKSLFLASLDVSMEIDRLPGSG